jgi:hypothetical protein
MTRLSSNKRFVLSLIVLLGTSFAQDGWAKSDEEGVDDIESALMDSLEDSEPSEQEVVSNEEQPEIGEDELQVFVLDRGYYVSSDLGVLMTLSSYSDPNCTPGFNCSRGYGNVTPYMSIKGGVDINDFLSAQINISTGYSSGNPVSLADHKTSGGDPIHNYGLFNMGLEAVGALRPTKRLAFELKAGGGLTVIDPLLSVDSATKYGALNAHVVAGLDIKYLTLLTHFTAGLTVNFYGILGEFGFIPALAFGGSVRYTL